MPTNKRQTQKIPKLLTFLLKTEIVVFLLQVLLRGRFAFSAQRYLGRRAFLLAADAVGCRLVVVLVQLVGRLLLAFALRWSGRFRLGGTCSFAVGSSFFLIIDFGAWSFFGNCSYRFLLGRLSFDFGHFAFLLAG